MHGLSVRLLVAKELKSGLELAAKMTVRAQENQQRLKAALWLSVQVYPSAVLLALILHHSRTFQSNSNSIGTSNSTSNNAFNINANSNPNAITHITYDIIFWMVRFAIPYSFISLLS